MELQEMDLINTNTYSRPVQVAGVKAQPSLTRLPFQSAKAPWAKFSSPAAPSGSARS